MSRGFDFVYFGGGATVYIWIRRIKTRKKGEIRGETFAFLQKCTFPNDGEGDDAMENLGPYFLEAFSELGTNGTADVGSLELRKSHENFDGNRSRFFRHL